MTGLYDVRENVRLILYEISKAHALSVLPDASSERKPHRTGYWRWHVRVPRRSIVISYKIRIEMRRNINRAWPANFYSARALLPRAFFLSISILYVLWLAPLLVLAL